MPPLRPLSAGSGEGRPRALLWAAGLALLTAVVARTALLGDRPFWRDEAWVASLVRDFPLRGVVDEVRTVPIGFIALEKAVAGALPFLRPEVAYRLVPLLCGLLAVAAVPALGLALGAARPVAVAALWICAGLPGLVYYSRELKQYGFDLLLPLALALVAHGSVEAREGGPPWRRVAAVALVAAAPWLSFGALFPLAVVLAWALWRTRREARARATWLAAALVLALSLGGSYLVALHVQAANPRLLETWRRHVRHGDQALLVDAAGALVTVNRTAAAYLFPDGWPLAVGLALLGIAAWPRRTRGLLVGLWLLPLALAAAAYLVDLYLVHVGRLLLFAAPPLVLLVAAGLVRAGEALRSAWWGVAAAALFGLGWAGASIVHRVRAPETVSARYFLFDVHHDVEPLIARLERERVPGRRVLASPFAGPVFGFYQRGRLAGATVCSVATCRDEPRVLAQWLGGLEGPGWMVVTDDEARWDRRTTLRSLGYRARLEDQTRGMKLWRVERVRGRPPGGP
ncbi:MAG TPA: hypothetical protein VII13_20610 [Vicinamibacteria bacterium]